MKFPAVFGVLLVISLCEAFILIIMGIYMIATSFITGDVNKPNLLREAMKHFGINVISLIIPALLCFLAAGLLVVRAVLLLLALTIQKPFALATETSDTLLQHYGGKVRVTKGETGTEEVVPTGEPFDEEGRYRMPDEEFDEGESGEGLGDDMEDDTGDGDESMDLDVKDDDEDVGDDGGDDGRPGANVVLDVPLVPEPTDRRPKHFHVDINDNTASDVERTTSSLSSQEAAANPAGRAPAKFFTRPFGQVEHMVISKEGERLAIVAGDPEGVMGLRRNTRSAALNLHAQRSKEKKRKKAKKAKKKRF